jgi:hypothetical protein
MAGVSMPAQGKLGVHAGKRPTTLPRQDREA